MNGTAHTITLASPTGLQTGDEVVYQTSGTALSGLTSGTSYYVIVVNATTIQLADNFSDSQDDVPLAIGPASDNTSTQSITSSDDTIHLGYNPNFTTGEAVTYRTNGQPISSLDSTGTQSNGLTVGGTYYVIVVDSTDIELADSYYDALAGNALYLPTSGASGTQTLGVEGVNLTVPPLTFSTSNVSSNIINLGVADGLSEGEPVTYVTTGTPISGLTSGQTYYVHVVSSTSVELSSSSQNLANGDYLTLNTSGASGTQSLVVKQVPGLTYSPTFLAGTQSLIIKLDPTQASGTSHSLQPVNASDQYDYITDTNGILHTVLASTIVSQTMLYTTTNGPSNSQVTLSNVVATAGNLTITAGTGTSYLTNLLLAGTVGSPAGTTTITTPAGYVQDAGATLDIQAVTASLQAGNSIGTSSTPLKTQIQTLSGSAGAVLTAGWYMNNTGNLNTNGVSASSNILFTLTNTASQYGTFTVNSGTSIVSSTGLVSIQATGDIHAGLGTTITAPNTVTLAGDTPDIKRATLIDVSGAIHGSTNYVVGNVQVDSVTSTNPDSFVLTNSSLTRYYKGALDDSFVLTSIERAYLTDTSTTGGNSFDISGWTQAGGLTNQSTNTDTLIITKPVAVTVTNALATAADGMSMGLTGPIHSGQLTDTHGGQTFNVSGWTGTATLLDTGPTPDTLVATKNADLTLSNTSLTSTDGMSLTIGGFNTVNLLTMGTSHTITVSGWTGTGTVGSSGTVLDTIVAAQNANFTLTNSSLVTSAGTSLTLANVGTANLTDTAGGHSFDVSGWSGAGTLTNSGSTADTLLVTKSTNVTLTNTSLAATDGESLRLTGKFGTAQLVDPSGGHTFTVGGWTGGGSLSSNGVADTVSASKSANFTLTNTQLATSDGMQLSLTNVTTANLTDSGGGHSFTISSWTGGGSLTDLVSTADTIVSAKNAGYTLSKSSLSSSDGMTMTLTSVTVANLTDTGGNHTVDVSGWTGKGAIVNSGSSADTLNASKNAGFTLTNAALSSTDGMSLTLNGFGTANLKDTGGNHTFDVGGWTGTGSLVNSGTLADTVAATKNGNFTLADTQLSTSDGMTMSMSGVRKASLTDTGNGHTFTVSGWTGTGSLVCTSTIGDIVAATKHATFTQTATSLSSTDGMSLTLTNIVKKILQST